MDEEIASGSSAAGSMSEEKTSSASGSTAQSKVDKSSYYFFKSTDPETAKKFKPKKIADPEPLSKKSTSGGSLWNTGATMEQYDYSDWFEETLKTELLKCTFRHGDGDGIRIHAVDKMDVSNATIILTRGKLRPGWDVSFTCKWKGTVSGSKVKGSISMEDVCDSDDSDDWPFAVKFKSSDSNSKTAATFIKKNKQIVLQAILSVVDQLRSKREAP